MISYSDKSFCDKCELWFGSSPDSDDIVKCPICHKVITSGVIQINLTTFRCVVCKLKFGLGIAKQSSDGEIKCPLCKEAA